jgi:hypothetical protein
METNLTVSTKAIEVIKMLKNAIAKSPSGVTFLSISNYTNNNGEIANHLINLGASLKKAKEKDLVFLQNLDVKNIEYGFKSEISILEDARLELIESIINPNENRRNGQIDAYTHIAPNLKVHNETGKLYIFGLRVSKNVIQKGEYPVKKSRPLTIAKNEISKNLKQSNFTNYAIEIGNTIKCSGDTLEL